MKIKVKMALVGLVFAFSATTPAIARTTGLICTEDRSLNSDQIMQCMRDWVAAMNRKDGSDKAFRTGPLVGDNRSLDEIRNDIDARESRMDYIRAKGRYCARYGC